MPRTARTLNPYGVYHVILRGVNRQQIFYDKEDYDTFLRILGHYRADCGFRLYAYCLMGNHVHLLIRTGETPLSSIFRKLGVAFVNWYNLKYQRTGHLFQDRFKSEPVADGRYFLTVLRYILQNPVKAGICARIEDYPYSSAREYLSLRDGITDTESALKLLGFSDIADYLARPNDDTCMEMESSPRRGLTDAAAAERIRREFGTLTPAAAAISPKQLTASLNTLTAEGISVRQLSRLTGLSRTTIANRLKSQDPGNQGDGSPAH